MTPNMMKTMANSPVVLEAYLSFSGALAGGILSAKLAHRGGSERLRLLCGGAHGNRQNGRLGRKRNFSRASGKLFRR